MNIVLIKPNNLSDHIQPSLGLGYLVSACRDKHTVHLIDCIKENLRVQNLVNKLEKIKPDLVGFQCYTFDLKYIKDALTKTKSLSKKIITVIGGPHPSAVPSESFEYFEQSLDYILKGESELGFPRLLDELEKGAGADLTSVPGLVWKKNNNVIINPQLFVEDLDSLGMPAWDLIRPEEYPEAQHGAFFEKFPIAPLIITRGCPYACTFCAGNIVSGKKIRKHSVEFVLKQIQYLYHERGIREFHVVDDNFTCDISYAKKLLRGLIDLKLDISWATPNGVRLDSLDDELLSLMKQSGLYLISLGIESGSDRILTLMKKNITTAEIREGIQKIHKAKIDVAGFFILGFPGETKEEIEKTIEFSRQLGLIRANFFTYLPFPGTESYTALATQKKLSKADWDHFYFMNAAYVPEGMTRNELKSLQRKAFVKFFMRPRIILKNLSTIRSLRHFLFLCRRFFRWLILH